MAEAVFMPRLGQSVESCIITEWVRKKGDRVNVGDVLFCYETDKAAFEETAKVSGILLDIFFQEGDEVPVLSKVAVIGNKGETADNFRLSAPRSGSLLKDVGGVKSILPESHSGEEINSIAERDANISERIKISPRAKNIARLKGLSLQGIQGTGPNGRIIVRDLELSDTQPKSFNSNKNENTGGNIKGDDSIDTPLSNVRKMIAKSMHASLQNSAQLTHHTSADARKMLELRALIKPKAEKGELPDISINDLVCYALIRALEKTPAINSHFLGDKIRAFTKVHLGIAVDTERGLIVPVIRNADELKLKALSEKIKEIADRCRKGNIDPDLLQSDKASFTVSNLGSYGIELFTPVINLPQTGILGVNTITYRPADIGNGTLGFIPVIGLSLTYDHRALDGAPASAFLREIRNQIEKLDKNII